VAQKSISKEDELRKVPLFSKLSKKTLAEIARIADVFEQPAGKVLLKEDLPNIEFVMILEGEAKAEHCGRLLGRLSQNDFFGEVSLISRRPVPATVTAETPMRLLVVEPRYFDALLERAPELWREIAIALCEYLPSTCDFPLEIEATPVTG
jgi:CRP-like cAMP-binding protein